MHSWSIAAYLTHFQFWNFSTNTKVEKDSDQNTTVLYELVSSNDKNTMPELYIKQDKNSLRWSTTKVFKKRQMSLLHKSTSALNTVQ